MIPSPIPCRHTEMSENNTDESQGLSEILRMYDATLAALASACIQLFLAENSKHLKLWVYLGLVVQPYSTPRRQVYMQKCSSDIYGMKVPLAVVCYGYQNVNSIYSYGRGIWSEVLFP